MDEAEKVLEQVDGMHLEFAKRAAVSKIFRQIKAVEGFEYPMSKETRQS